MMPLNFSKHENHDFTAISLGKFSSKNESSQQINFSATEKFSRSLSCGEDGWEEVDIHFEKILILPDHIPRTLIYPLRPFHSVIMRCSNRSKARG